MARYEIYCALDIPAIPCSDGEGGCTGSIALQL